MLPLASAYAPSCDTRPVTHQDLFGASLSTGSIRSPGGGLGAKRPSDTRAPAIALASSEGCRLQRAEHRLLELADFIYGHTSLKPMSKTLFVLSRCLLAAPGRRDDTVAEIVRSYERQKTALGIVLTDDFNLPDILTECREHLGHILSIIEEVKRLCSGSDSLGLAFNTLLRGKWESGEGLGTHLTPEEVVEPMVRMALASVTLSNDGNDGAGDLLLGDPCGGTGRFVYCFAGELRHRDHAPSQIRGMLRLYDQSALSVDFACLNFAFAGFVPRFVRVEDSLTCVDLSNEAGRYLAVATNPPFGTGKYRWTPSLEKSLGTELLAAIGMRGAGDACDPATLFLFRCLDLLALEGVLAIVLPDGIIRAKWFKDSLLCYESTRACHLHLLAIVSLPTATFSLGGTVAKTSFLLLRRSRCADAAHLYVAQASHVGFKKRGNRRISDPAGNDLTTILDDYLQRREHKGRWLRDGWRRVEQLVPSLLLSNSNAPKLDKATPLSHLARLRHERGSGSTRAHGAWYHVSVLDLDNMGTIDVAAASINQPATRPQACRAGDVLVSCLNPRIWRVAVVPSLAGVWTCSGEFAVLVPREDVNAWELAVALHQKVVIERTMALAGGTSSSRQRVNRSALLELRIPEIHIDAQVIQRYGRTRENYYRERIREYQAFARLHQGEGRFSL